MLWGPKRTKWNDFRSSRCRSVLFRKDGANRKGVISLDIVVVSVEDVVAEFDIVVRSRWRRKEGLKGIESEAIYLASRQTRGW